MNRRKRREVRDERNNKKQIMGGVGIMEGECKGRQEERGGRRKREK